MSTIEQVEQTTNIYALYFFKKYASQIIFNVYNVNLIMFILWTIVYYTIYYHYMVKNVLTYRMESLDNNVITSYYNTLFIKRFLPFCGYVFVLVVLQYVINTSMMRNMCKQDIFIDYRTLNIFTLFPWIFIMFGLFFIIYKFPSIKGIYSKTIVHKILHYIVDANNIIQTIIHQSDLPNDEEYNSIRDLFKSLQTNPAGVSFIEHIHISNYKEYLNLMDPILRKDDKKTETLNNFLVFLIKKDLISEFFWIIKIGVFISLFIYIRLKNLKCTNYERTQEDYVQEYIKEKIKTCDANCDFESKMAVETE